MAKRSMNTPARTTTRQLLSRTERSASILAAAARAFARAGFAATSMDDVATEAGVTKLIVYRHFDSKEQLYAAVLERVSTDLRDEFLAQMETPGHERFGYTTRALLTVARRQPEGVRLLFVHAEREPQFAHHRAEHWEGAVDVARTLIGDRIGDVLVKEWAAQAAVRYLINGVLVWLDTGTADRDEEFIVLSTHGLLAMFMAWIEPSSFEAAKDRFNAAQE